MRIHATILILLCLLGTSISALGQSYFANGSAVPISNSSCYQLTPAAEFQLGSVWYADKIDLSKNFDLEFELNFGNKDANGADGIVFVLQTVGNRALGLSGGGMGFEGFSPSLGIEFDVWQNNDMADLSADHIAIIKNGSVRHSGANSIASPVPALENGGNIEDGTDHLVRITWEVTTNRLEVWFDCVKRQSVSIDLQNSIFGGQQEVFWGFTSATGGSSNRQVACLRDDILLQDTFALCKGETIPLNAKESFDGTYSWTPTDFLDDPTSRTPECSTIIPFTYYVEYKDRCNNTFLDTVDITIDEPFTMDEAEDTLLCDGARYAFDLRNEYDSVRWGNGSVQPFTFWQAEGFYRLRAWKGVCYDDDSFNITTNTSPELQIIGDSLFCEGDSVELTVTFTPEDVDLLWPDLSTNDTKYYSTSSTILVRGTNECNASTASYKVYEVVISPFTLGVDTLLCTGDSIELLAPLQANYTYLWSTGATGNKQIVTEAADVWLQVLASDFCLATDSIRITEVVPPTLQDLEDVLLCNTQEITLSAVNLHGDVIWNNTVVGNSFVLKDYDGPLTVKTENACGADSVSIEVSLIDCYCNLDFPSAFTPNQDNLNETLNPYVDCPKLAQYVIKVYNRWGEQVYESTDIEKSWDGSYKGVVCPNGVYFWVANWSGIENGLTTNKVAKGVATLLR